MTCCATQPASKSRLLVPRLPSFLILLDVYHYLLRIAYGLEETRRPYLPRCPRNIRLRIVGWTPSWWETNDTLVPAAILDISCLSYQYLTLPFL